MRSYARVPRGPAALHPATPVRGVFRTRPVPRAVNFEPRRGAPLCHAQARTRGASGAKASRPRRRSATRRGVRAPRSRWSSARAAAPLWPRPAFQAQPPRSAPRAAWWRRARWLAAAKRRARPLPPAHGVPSGRRRAAATGHNARSLPKPAKVDGRRRANLSFGDVKLTKAL